MARHDLFIKLPCRRNSPTIPQFNLLIVLFAHVSLKLFQNPILLPKFFRGSERIKSVAMVRQYSKQTYRCALENFTSYGKFWEKCKILEASCQTGRSPRFVSRVMFVRPTQWSEKLLFFTMQCFVICHTIKTQNYEWKILGAPHNYFQLFRSGCWGYENLIASVFRQLDFPSFSQLLPNFQNFPAYGSAFPAATAATAAAFPAFWRRSSRIATGAVAQGGMASPRDYTRLVKFGRIVKIWKP